MASSHRSRVPTTSQAADEGRYRAPALDKGLDIVELLSSTDQAMTLKDIAEALGRSPTEIYRMLDRLAWRGYVARRGDGYELTMKLFMLAHRQPPVQRLVSQAMPLMRRFTRQAEQSCHLVRYDRGDMVVIAQVEAPGYWGVTIRVGARIGLVNTGSGLAFLAFAPEEERRFMLDEHELLPFETAPGDLDRRLAEIRARGHVIMDSFQTPALTNIAVPILGPNGSVLAALTCPFLRRLENPDAPDRDRVVDLLIAAGDDLSGRE